MTRPILQLDRVGKSYRSFAHQWGRFRGWFTGAPVGFEDHWVLRDVSLTVKPGESVGILGRNGAGKSTLLKLIAGVLTPTEGSIAVLGRVNAILELGSGINPEFTAKQNVLHACGLLGMDREAIEAALPTIRKFADIGEYFEQPMRTFSSGMQMRVAFATATAFRPDILIVDEAMAVGDLLFQAKCFERVAALRDSGTTLLFVSHAVTEVVKHCERALFIREGRIAHDGPAREVSNLYLDHMFGRSRGRQASSGGEAGPGVDSYATDRVDRFHTRPGYRKDEHRWGSGGVRISDFQLIAGHELFPPIVTTHEALRVSFKVDFERAVTNPVYGLLVKTLDGIFVYGVNSREAKGDAVAEAVGVGESRVVAFDFPVTLNTGGYLVSVGVSERGEEVDLVPLDRRYDAILFQVNNSRPVPGFVDLDARFSVLEMAGPA